MKNPIIAVVTTCKKEYKKYINTQPIGFNFQKISVLKDIKTKDYDKVVLLKNSENITDYVIKTVTKSALEVEDLSDRFIY